MWKRFSGKSDAAVEKTPSRSTRRNENNGRSHRSSTGSIASSHPESTSRSNKTLEKDSSSRGDDRDRGFNPVSSSYSSTTQSAYPGTASASVATASSNHNDEPYMPAGLVRNASLADQMPTSKSSRDNRDRDGETDLKSGRRRKRDSDGGKNDREDRRKEKGNGREKEGKDRAKRSSRSSRYSNGDGAEEGIETSRGPADFPDQIGAAGFSQFPGQYDGGIPRPNGYPADHPLSSHVQDQFPGQFPLQSSAPYRPPVSMSEGGPGLAAEYYGDAGESVAQQPGNRTGTPSLIVGAEPHLLPASAVAAPPPEPSASGGVGAAASFYSGNFDDSENMSSQSPQPPSTYTTAQVRPNSAHHTSSNSALPTLGGAAVGAAAGYAMGSQNSSHSQHPGRTSSVGIQSATFTHQRPPSPTAESYYSHESRPSRPSKHSSQSSNLPLYAAGAAGLAAAGYHHSQRPNSQHTSNTPQNFTTPMVQRHCHRGPFGAVVDFFKDPDGVAQFEEYSEIIGVCRHCFAPGSSPRDAPRKHNYRKRRSNESFGRVDKDNRYHSSENEGRRKKDESWLATGLAGYGLAKVGESLFKQKNDFDDTYSVKSGRRSPERGSRRYKPWSRSKDRFETEITNDSRVYRKTSRDDFASSAKATQHGIRRQSRSRSRSDSRRDSRVDIGIGAIVGSEPPLSSARRRRSKSPPGASIRNKHKKSESHLGQRPKTHRRKKARGFFSFGDSSSSSSSVDLQRSSDRSKRSSSKTNNDKKAEAAILGLGAAAAALAINDSRNGHKRKDVKKLVGVKETKALPSRGSNNDPDSEEEVWESAPENEYESADSALAYGAPRRRGSQASLSSQSSGTDKWDWRWGSKKRKDSPSERRVSGNANLPSGANSATIDTAGSVVMSPDHYQEDVVGSTSSLPLQQVFPMPTSDPTRFDVGKEDSAISSSRPAVVPIHHPQPITPVSASLYSTQAPYDHSYSAPTGLPTVSHPHSQSSNGFSAEALGRSGRFIQDNSQARDKSPELNKRRRDSSPARFGVDAVTSSIAPRRRSSAKDDTSSTVRFARTEEEEEDDRRERRRKRREDRERREAEEQEQLEKDHESIVKSSGPTPQWDAGNERKPERSLEESWAVPAAAGVVGAAIGAAAAVERSKGDETREERRERRRRERESEEAEDREASRRRERRRREREERRERDVKEAVETPSVAVSSRTSEDRKDSNGQPDYTNRGQQSIWQEAASPKRSATHENYGDFFRPLDLSDDQVKITGANPDADVELDQTPAIVTVAPKGFRDPDAQPVFSPADTDEKIDLSKLSFPVPKLRLVEPTPPSSRGSTPTIRPHDTYDEVVEDVTENTRPTKVTWEDEGPESTAVAPKDLSHEIIEVDPDEVRHRDPVDSSQSHDEATSAVDMESSKATPMYEDDVGFAATLAASAEDAGFDPSIVIENPEYRRRESPPGSEDRSMPGGFDIDNESTLTKKERKKKDRAARRKDREETPQSRDDDAVVQDIISQVEKPDAPMKEDPENGLDNWQAAQEYKPKKSEKGRQDPEPGDEVVKNIETANESRESGSREAYESPGEDISPMVPAKSKKEGSKKSRKNSKRDGTILDDAASSASLQSAVSVVSGSAQSDPTTKAKPKSSSVWDRVLGRSRNDEPNMNVDNEVNVDHFVEPKKKSKKKSKGRNLARDELDDGRENVDTITRSDIPENPPNDATSDVLDSGRITQDLPARVDAPASPGSTGQNGMLIREKDRESDSRDTKAGSVGIQDREDRDTVEHCGEQGSESFLDMRPDPPPPPDMSPTANETPDPFDAPNLPSTPRSLPENRSRQPAEAHVSEPMASPTAVPFDFRFSRPRPSFGSGRSMSQTPVSTHPSVSQPPRPKPRPRSTEFSSSKEFRPLMLVERHRPHQDSAPEEAYPSLPSSRTTSRSTSVKDPDEGQRGDFEMIEREPQQFEAGHPSVTDAGIPSSQLDLLDSQEATPTASSFHHAVNDDGSIPAASERGSSPDDLSDEKSLKPDLAIAGVATAVGASAAFVIHKANQDADTPLPSLSKDEHNDLQRGLNEIALEEDASRSLEDRTAKKTDSTGQGDVNVSPGLTQQNVELQQKSGDLLVNEANEKPDAQPEHDEQIEPNSFIDGHPQDVEVGNLKDSADDNVYHDEGLVAEETLDDRLDFLPQRTKKDKKGKRKQKGIPQGQDPILKDLGDGAKPDSKIPSPLSRDQVLKHEEQDTQDAVDDWFSPPKLSKKDKKKKKGMVEQPPEPDRAPQIFEDSPRDNEPTDQINDPGVTELYRKIVTEPLSDAGISLNQRSDKPEEISPQQDISPNEGFIKSQLSRRQSKSKGKKAKKSSKNSPRDEEIQPASHFSEDPAVNESFPEQLGEKVVSSSPDITMVLPKEVETSPSAIPLPMDDDLDLGQRLSPDTDAKTQIEASTVQDEPLPDILESQSPAQSEKAVFEECARGADEVAQDRENADSALTSPLSDNNMAKIGFVAGSEIGNQESSLGSTQSPSISLEQAEGPTRQSMMEEAQENSMVAEDEEAGFSRKKKVKKGKKSKQRPEIEGNEDVLSEPSTPLPKTTRPEDQLILASTIPEDMQSETVDLKSDKTVDEMLSRGFTAGQEDQTPGIEDEWAGFNPKKKAKKGKKGKRGPENEADVDLDKGLLASTATPDLDQPLDTKAVPVQSVAGANEENFANKEEPPAPSSKKKAKKAKKAKSEVLDDPPDGGEAESLKEVPEEEQPPIGYDTPAIETPQEELNDAKDEWADFSTKSKKKKGKKQKRSMPDAIPTDTPFEALDPQPVGLESVAREASEPNSVDAESAAPKVFDSEPIVVEPGPVVFEPPEVKSSESTIAEIESTKHELNDMIPEAKLVDVNRVETKSQEAKPAPESKPEPEMFQTLEQESSKPVDQEQREVQLVSPAVDEPVKPVQNTMTAEDLEPQFTQLSQQGFFGPTEPLEVKSDTVESDRVTPSEHTPKDTGLKESEPTIPSQLGQQVESHFHDLRQDGEELSNDGDNLRAPTSTSEEVATMLETEKRQPFDETVDPEAISGQHIVNIHAEELNIDEGVRDPQSSLPQDEDSHQSLEDFENQEVDLIDQYSTRDMPAKNENLIEEATGPLVSQSVIPETPESPEMEVIDEYSRDDKMQSPFESSSAMTNTAQDVKNILGTGQAVEVPGPISEPADKPFNTMQSPSIESSEIAVSEAASKGNKQDEDIEDAPAVSEASEKKDLSQEAFGDTAKDVGFSEEPGSNHHQAIEILPSAKVEAETSAQASLSSDFRPNPDIATEIVKDASTREIGRDMESESLENIPDVDEGVQSIEERRLELEALKGDQYEDKGLEAQNLELSTIADPVEPSEPSDSIHVNEAKVTENYQSAKGKKDKKKSKKAKALAWEEEASPVPLAEDKSLEGVGDIASDMPESSTLPLKQESTEIPENRQKTKKERKKAKKAQSTSWESSVDQDSSIPADDFLEQSKTESSMLPGQGALEKPAVFDKQGDTATNDALSQESYEQMPTSSQNTVASAMMPSGQMTTPSEDLQVQSRDEDAQMGQPIEADEYPTFSLKKSKKDKKKGKKAQSLTLDNNQSKRESEQTIDDSVASGTQDEPSIMPISEDRSSWLPQDRLTEQVQPTEVIQPGGNEFDSHSLEDTTKETTSSATIEGGSQPFEADSNPIFSMKDKKGRKSKIQTLPTFESPTDSSRLEQTVVLEPKSGDSRDTFTEEKGLDNAENREESSYEPNLENPPSPIKEEAKEILDETEAQDDSTPRPEDEFKSMASKKSKKNKKQRKGKSKSQQDEEVPQPMSFDYLGKSHDSPDPETATSFGTEEQGTGDHTTVRSIQTPQIELLNPLEQRKYDLEYAQELERHGVDSPRSSRVDLPASAVDAEDLQAHSSLRQDQHQQDIDITQTSAMNLSTPPAQDRQEGSLGHVEHAQDPEEYGFEQAEPLETSATDGTEPTKDHLKHSLEPSQSLGEVDDTSQLSTRELPTPVAEIRMLDAQEQEKYDADYAKELERQLSPLQEAELSSVPAQEDISSFPSPSMDSLVELPLEQRTHLARPPPLEDIIEEPRSRSGSVQNASLDHGDEASPLELPKKSKKGKKGKKQQREQPIIWEDETATPPVNVETDQIPAVPSQSPTNTDRPIDLEEPIEQRPIAAGSNPIPSPREQAEGASTSDDYFNMRPSTLAEADVGQSLEKEELRPLSSTEPTQSGFEGQPERGETTSEIDSDPLRRLGEADEKSTEYTDTPSWPEAAPTPANTEEGDDYSYTTTKRGKKGKKSKKRQLDMTPTVPISEPEQLTEQSKRGEDSLAEDFGRVSPSPEHPNDLNLHPETKSILGGTPLQKTDSKVEGTGDLGMAAGLGAALVASESLSRRDSKRTGKKSKKGKKTQWTDIESEAPNSADLPVDSQAPESARQDLILEPENVFATEQDRQKTPPTSSVPSTSNEPTSFGTNVEHVASQPEYPSYRDSAVIVADSPTISDEPIVHHVVRDSGYPETELSPTMETEEVYSGHPMEESDELPRGRRVEQYTEDDDHGHVMREPEKSPARDGSSLPSSEVADHRSTPTPKPTKRQRRSRSYDSDDSADSGFDIQRRRRREARHSKARSPSPVSSTTKDRSSALFNSSPSAREDPLARTPEHAASTSIDSIHQEPTWSFNREDSPLAESHDTRNETDPSHASREVPDPSTYEKLTGHRQEPSESLFGGPIRPNEDDASDTKSPPDTDIRGRRRRLDTISEDSQDKTSLHGKDKRAVSDVGSPEAGIKGRRLQSPPSTIDSAAYATATHARSDTAKGLDHSGGDPLSSERSRSRNTDGQSTGYGDLSNQTNVPPRQREGEHRTASAASIRSDNSIHAIIRTPDQVRSASGQSYRSSGTPPLRRTDRSVSGDLRAASKLGEAKSHAKSSEADLADINIPSSSTYDPVTDKGKNRADMADVYVSADYNAIDGCSTNLRQQEGWGDVRGQSPMSPTRPPSMRKRQSMQLLDLETRLDQLVSENRLLHTQKSNAERTLQDQTRDHSQQRHAYEEALKEHKAYLTQKDSELNELREIVDQWKSKVDELTEVNESLSASQTLVDENAERYRQLEDEHIQLQERHSDLSSGMEALVQREVASHLEAKNSELQRLRVELDYAKQQVRSLQQQLTASRESEDFVERDDDYFDNRCYALCQQVQQWVLRFSKFSDNKACYRASEIRDETKVDRMENAILDGTDVDVYLQDRIKRRDVFMAVLMKMVFDYIFTRYLFGMDREQRQKLKNLEKTLQEVGPLSAVHKWRATTCTLLMKREDFARQRATDIEAIVHEVYDTLATFLPPPLHLVGQIQDSLRKVINSAADLSIEMRTQRARYEMWPPLQPIYDTNGDLTQKHYFNALSMNDRSGSTTSNEALEEQKAALRIMLFPAVARVENDDESTIIVCPAQVVTANSKGKKTVRVMSVQGSTQGGRSEASFADTDMGEVGMI